MEDQTEGSCKNVLNENESVKSKQNIDIPTRSWNKRYLTVFGKVTLFKSLFSQQPFGTASQKCGTALQKVEHVRKFHESGSLSTIFKTAPLKVACYFLMDDFH